MGMIYLTIIRTISSTQEGNCLKNLRLLRIFKGSQIEEQRGNRRSPLRAGAV